MDPPETRRLQRMGRSTLVVSLPTEWVKRNALKPSDRVFIETETDDSIVLRPGAGRKVTRRSCIIHADKCARDPFLARMIVGAYLMGCDSIRVVGLPPERREVVTGTAGLLTGLVTVSQGENEIALQSFIDVHQYPLASLEKRMYMIAEEMHLRFAEAVSAKPTGAVEASRKLGVESDRIYFLAVRQLLQVQGNPSLRSVVGVKVHQHLLGSRMIALALEGVADSCEEMTAHAWEAATTCRKGVGICTSMALKRESDAWALLNQAFESLHAEDLKRANTVVDSVKGAVQALEADMREVQESDMDRACSVHLLGVLFGCKAILGWAKTLGLTTINRALLDEDSVSGVMQVERSQE